MSSTFFKNILFRSAATDPTKLVIDCEANTGAVFHMTIPKDRFEHFADELLLKLTDALVRGVDTLISEGEQARQTALQARAEALASECSYGWVYLDTLISEGEQARQTALQARAEALASIASFSDYYTDLYTNSPVVHDRFDAVNRRYIEAMYLANPQVGSTLRWESLVAATDSGQRSEV